ncbi:MAG: hypothetical protein ACI82Q_001994 [Nonlabens sp.]|jgi:hypothetical protein
MPKIIKIEFIIFVIITTRILTSCGEANESRFESELLVQREALDSLTFSSIVGDTLRFAPPFTGVYGDFQSFSLNDSSFWVGLKSADLQLDFYSLDQKVALKSIAFEAEGPNGVEGSIDGFFYHNPDTIFLLSIDANRIYLMNDKAKRIDLFDFSDLPLPDGFDDYDVYANDGFQNGPYYVSSNKTIQFYTYSWYSDPEDQVNHTAFASFSIVDRDFLSIYGVYPDNYQKGDNYALYNDPVLTVVDTLSFVQFGASESLAAYNNISGELLYMSNEHCEHWSKALEPVGSYYLEEGRDWLIEQPAYPVLLHDEDNRLLYRFLKHRQLVLDDSGSYWFGPFCISMYDYGLQRLGHYELPANTFLPVLAFTAKGDLWIKNPALPDDENTSLFYRFEPAEK